MTGRLVGVMLVAAALVGCGDESGAIPLDADITDCDDAIDAMRRGDFQPDGSLRVRGASLSFGESGSCGGEGAESIVRYVPEIDGVLHASAAHPGTSIDTVLYLRKLCDQSWSELACNDDAVGTRSEVDVQVTAGVPVYLFVDSFERGEGGSWELTIRVDPIPDGGVVEPMDGDVVEPSSCEMPLDVEEVGVPRADGSVHVEGATEGQASVHEGSCGGDGVEAVLRYAAPTDGVLVVSSDLPGTFFDTVLHLRGTCDDAGSELACDDDGATGTRSEVSTAVTAGQEVYVFVDGYRETSAGPFEVSFTMTDVPDAGMDAAPPDTGPPDTGPPDTGPPDTGPPDTGPPDTGPPDTGPPDTGPPDTGPPDTGPADTGPPDTGPPDTGPPDTGPPDTGPADTGPPDTGPADAGLVCADGTANCNGFHSDGCEITITSDPAHCSGCFMPCPALTGATAGCTDSACTYTCDEPMRDCVNGLSDGCETNILTTPAHCGGCNMPCPGSQMCCDGTCRANC